jgi:hypothetical protein
MVAQAHPHQVDDRVLHRHLDVLAAAGRMALLQRCQNADRHVHAGAGIPDRRIDVGRRIFGEAGDAHRPAHGLGDRLEALESAVRPVGAEALDRGVDKSRVDLAQGCVAEPEAIERARPEILHQHVRLGDHLPEQILAGVGLEIQRQAALVGVQDQEEQAVAILLVAHVHPRNVAALGLLELDHVGTEEAENLRAGGPRLVVRHVDDADA